MARYSRREAFVKLLLYIFVLGIAEAFAPPVSHDSPVGMWKTIDDKTHKPRGLVRIYEQDGALYGRIEGGFDPAESKQLCDKCSGELRHKPLLGLVILRGMKKHGDEYSGGEILDPDTGSFYRCRITMEDHGSRLVVRGYIGLPIAGRSQTWLRAE